MPSLLPVELGALGTEARVEVVQAAETALAHVTLPRLVENRGIGTPRTRRRWNGTRRRRRNTRRGRAGGGAAGCLVGVGGGIPGGGVLGGGVRAGGIRAGGVLAVADGEGKLGVTSLERGEALEARGAHARLVQALAVGRLLLHLPAVEVALGLLRRAERLGVLAVVAELAPELPEQRLECHAKLLVRLVMEQGGHAGGVVGRSCRRHRRRWWRRRCRRRSRAREAPSDMSRAPRRRSLDARSAPRGDSSSVMVTAVRAKVPAAARCAACRRARENCGRPRSLASVYFAALFVGTRRCTSDDLG